MIDLAALCLAMNIYYEARNQPIEGQISVGNVTINRVKKNKSKVCVEVYKPKQFSWTTRKRPIPKNDDKSWILAKAISKEILNGNIKDITNGAIFFNHKRLKKRNIKKTVSFGEHVFSKEIRIAKM